MQERLFEEFDPIQREAWLEKIKADLKGKPLESLKWTSEEGLDMFPVFTKEDLPPQAWLDHNFPGQAPFLRGHHPYGSEDDTWEIRHEFRAESISELIRLVNESGTHIQGIGLVLGLPFREFLFDWEERALPLQKPRDGIHLKNAGDMQELLAGIDWTGARKLHLRAGHAILPAYTYLVEAWTKATGLPLSELKGTLDLDPLNRLGHDPSNDALRELLFEDSAAVIHHIEQQGIRDLKALRISLEPHHFLGAHAVQQIACALALSVEYAHTLQQKHGLDLATVFRHLHFQFPIDTDFFTEIAKLRAFRVLFQRLSKAYTGESIFPYIHGMGAARSLSSLDHHVNLLRSTTEAMSAILGGCDAISMPAYNSLSEHADAHAIRIARNIQLILREESDFGKVVDPGGGSYLVESLSYQFADRAWKLAGDIEEKGGYLEVWRKGELLKELFQQRQKTDHQVARGKKPLLGVNRFPNAADTPPTLLTTGYSREYPLPKRDFFEVPVQDRVAAMLDDFSAIGDLGGALEARYQRLGGQLGKTAPLQRLAEPFEALRSQAYEYEQDGFPRPSVLLFTFGPLKMRKARANFARNLLGSGGFEILENAHPDDPAAALEALPIDGLKAIVFCSANESYLEDATQTWMGEIQAKYPELRRILAGQPPGWEGLQETGLIHDCIFAGMDSITWLNDLHETTQIKEVKHEI